MNGGTYVSALLQLTQHPSEAVIRRALKLFTARFAKLSQQDARPRAEIADDASQGSAEAALELCNIAPALLQTGSSSLASCGTAALSFASHDAVWQKRPGFLNILLIAVAAMSDTQCCVKYALCRLASTAFQRLANAFGNC